MLQSSEACADMELLPRVCFCFLTLSGLTFGDQSGPRPTTVTVKEGDDVVLPCSLGTSVNIESKLFDWKKKGPVPWKEVFMYDPNSTDTDYKGQDEQFKGRVSHFPGELKQGNASIRINKARLEDNGNYTCIFPSLSDETVFTIELIVGPGVTVVVSEGSDAILPCSLSTKESAVQKLFDWKKVDQKTKEVFIYGAGIHYNNGRIGQDEQFKGRVSHFPDQLQFGNASIIIRNTTVADSGEYTCDFPRLPSEQTTNIKLVVGAAPKPDICMVNITEDGVLLKCKVQGSPKPKVEWQDSDGNLLPAEEPQVSYRGDRYYITLFTTVTKAKTNWFHCVATQEELSHRTENKIYVPYYENLFKDTSGEVVPGLIGWFLGLLTSAFVLAVLVAKKRITMHSKKGDPGNTNRGLI